MYTHKRCSLGSRPGRRASQLLFIECTLLDTSNAHLAWHQTHKVFYFAAGLGWLPGHSVKSIGHPHSFSHLTQDPESLIGHSQCASLRGRPGLIAWSLSEFLWAPTANLLSLGGICWAPTQLILLGTRPIKLST